MEDMRRVGGSATHLRTESRSRQTQSPPGCDPLLSLSLPIPDLPPSPFVCCAAHLGLLCPRFPFPFLRFALPLSPCLVCARLFRLRRLDTLLTRPAAWRSFVQTVLDTPARGGGLSIPKCDCYTQWCASVWCT